MSAETHAVTARRTIIHAAGVRSVLGRDIEPGDVLTTGVVLEVTRNDIDGESRLEMPGADIHYVDHDEPVLVLATVDRDVLDGISLGTFMARADLRAVQPAPEPVEPDPEPVVEPVAAAAPATQPTSKSNPAKSNPGPLGQYEPDVEHYTDTCPIHGETTFARHKAGRSRAGEQRYNHRCLACHTDYNLSRRG